MVYSGRISLFSCLIDQLGLLCFVFGFFIRDNTSKKRKYAWNILALSWNHSFLLFPSILLQLLCQKFTEDSSCCSIQSIFAIFSLWFSYLVVISYARTGPSNILTDKTHVSNKSLLLWCLITSCYHFRLN